MTVAPPSLPFLCRHARVWLYAARIATSADDMDGFVVRHAQLGRPFVMRRAMQDDPVGCVPLALRLPPGNARRGLSFAVARDTVVRAALPLSLAEARRQAMLPAAWLAPLAALDAAIAPIGVTPYVYGSLAWQCMTDECYLHDGSDVDLLLRPNTIAQAHACLTALQRFEKDVPLDGEIELPDGRAVAWRELTGDTRYVLVKSAQGVTLTERESIWHPQQWN